MCPTITIYTKPGCHLCEDAEGVARLVQRDHDFDLRLVNILDDAALQDQFWSEIPVIFVNGVEIARHRLDPRRLRESLLGVRSKH